MQVLSHWIPWWKWCNKFNKTAIDFIFSTHWANSYQPVSFQKLFKILQNGTIVWRVKTMFKKGIKNGTFQDVPNNNCSPSHSMTQNNNFQKNSWCNKKNRKIVSVQCILANFQISERGTNERKKIKKRNIPKFPTHYYTKIAAKTGTHDKIILFFASKRGTVPPKEEQLASMTMLLSCSSGNEIWTAETWLECLHLMYAKNIVKYADKMTMNCNLFSFLSLVDVRYYNWLVGAKLY